MKILKFYAEDRGHDYEIKLEFETCEELEWCLQNDIKEFEKLRVCVSEDKLSEFYNNLDIDFKEIEGKNLHEVIFLYKSNLKPEDVFIEAYRENERVLHDFLEKNDNKYTYHEYFQKIPIVETIIEYLQDLSTRTPGEVEYDLFYRHLQCLSYFWD